MASWTGKKSNVMWAKPEAPSFLKKFKERVGYKEDHGLSEKFVEMPAATDDDVEDRDDELPQVVQLSPGDISQEEYDAFVAKSADGSKKLNEDSVPSKITFRPSSERKNAGDKSSHLSASTKRKKSGEDPESGSEKTKSKKKREKSNVKLLSFDQEEDDL